MLETLGVKRPYAIRWICPLLLVTFIVNAIFLVPVTLEATERHRLPDQLVYVTPVVSLVIGIAITVGIRDRKRWAWIIAMLIFSSLFLGATGWMATRLFEAPGLALMGLFAAAMAWGLPAGLLYHLRELYFPPSPED